MSHDKGAEKPSLLFKMDEGPDGYPLAGILWLHFGETENEAFTELEDVVETVESTAAVVPADENEHGENTDLNTLSNAHDMLVENDAPRADTEPLPPIFVDVSELRRLIPEGTHPLTLAPALLPGDFSVSTIGASHWIPRVFNKIYFRAHKTSIGLPEREEAAHIYKCLELEQGSKVLDAGCGYGRLSIPLAELGADVVAMDISPAMTEQADTFAREMNVTLETQRSDFRILKDVEVYDGLICTDTTFGSFSDYDNLSTLLTFRDALKVGGLLYLEVVNRDLCIRNLPNRTWWEGRGCLVQEDAEFDQLESRIRVKRLVVTAEGTQDECHIDVRLYSIHELIRLLKLTGFEIVSTGGGCRTQGAFFAASSEKLVVVARKNAQ